MTYQILLIQTLTGTKQLLASRPAHDEILCKVDTPDTIETADERLPCCVVDARHDGADEEGSEPSLVERRAD